jgi:hypothetical protein
MVVIEWSVPGGTRHRTFRVGVDVVVFVGLFLTVADLPVIPHQRPFAFAFALDR